MPRTASAPTFVGDGKIVFADRDYPDPGPGQLLMSVEDDAICGTDREQYYEGSECVPGHEAAGTVIATGAQTRTEAGTRGAVFLMDYCGACRSCLAGYTSQCLAKRNDMGFTADGGYGPFKVVHETNFFPVPSDLSAAESTLLLDVMGTGSHALGRIVRVREDVESLFCSGGRPDRARRAGDGQGPLRPRLPGLHQRRLAVAPGVRQVARRHPCRCPGAGRDSGALRHRRRRRLDGKTAVRASIMQLLGKRGVLACVGHGEGLSLTVSPDLIATEGTVMGSEYFHYAEMEENLGLLLDNRDYVGQIITHRMPRGQISEAFDLFLAGETGKVIVEADPS